MDLSEATAIVGEGIALLDARCGYWWTYMGGFDDEWNLPLRSINLDTLRTSLAECCPLGQMYGSFDEAPNGLRAHPAFHLPRPATSDEMSAEQIVAVLFEHEGEYVVLDRAWLHAIKARRNG